MNVPILIEEPAELPPEKKVLTSFLLNGGISDIQDFVNLISIVYGIRTGGIIKVHPSGFETFKKDCEAIGIAVRKYPMGDPKNVILVRGADPAILDSLPHLVETNKSEFHRVTGELIGYFEPYDVFNKNVSSTKKTRVAIELILKAYNGRTETTDIFSQRVSSAEPYLEQLETMADALRSLDATAYLPYTLVSVKVATLKVGGKRRKSRRKSKGRRTKKGRKVVGSS